MNETTPLHPDVQVELNEVMVWLDELTVDPRCDTFSARQIAKAVRTLVPVMVRRPAYGTAGLDRMLAEHEALDMEPTAGAEPCDAVGADCDNVPLATLVTRAFVNIAAQALVYREQGDAMQATGLAGMSMVLKAVALALSGRSEAGLNAIWSWAGLGDCGRCDGCQQDLQDADTPLDLLGIEDEFDQDLNGVDDVQSHQPLEQETCRTADGNADEPEHTGDDLDRVRAQELALNAARRLVRYLELGAPQILTLHTVWRLLAKLREVYGYQDNEALLAAASDADVTVMGTEDDE